MNNRDIVCIVCPNGCRMNVTYDENNEIVTTENALCKRGKEYAYNELNNPMRSLTSTVKVKGGNLPLVSVRSNVPIPKAKMFEIINEIRTLELIAPVKYHQVLIENILSTGANIIATRDVDAI